MSLMEILLLLVVATVCGAIARALAGSYGGSFLVSTAFGFIGALLGFWMARGLNWPEPFLLELGRVHFPVLWSIVGGIMFVAILSLFRWRRRSY